MRLLLLEWKKLAPNRMFRIATVMYVVLLPLLFLAVKASQNDGGANNSAAMDMILSNYKFPRIWDAMAYWASWLTFFIITYLAVWMVTAEHGFKTSRQNLITGINRNQYLTGKLMMLVVLTIGATIYMALVTTVFGLIAGGYGDPFDSEIYAIAYFFLQTFFYASLAFMLAVLFRKSGMAMMIFFAYTLIIERIVYYLVFLQLLESTSFGNYLPASAAWFLVPFYFFKSNAKGFMDDFGNENIAFLSSGEAAVAVLIYTALFWLISYWWYNRKDL